MNGHIVNMSLYSLSDIFDYVIKNGKEVGIDSDDLLFYEQIKVSGEKENKEGKEDDKEYILYVIIDHLETFHFSDVSSWIVNRNKNQRLLMQTYVQYLANRGRLELDKRNNYCELWYKNDDDKFEKVSNTWKHSDDVFDETNQGKNDGFILCKFLVMVFGRQYYVIVNFPSDSVR